MNMKRLLTRTLLCAIGSAAVLSCRGRPDMIVPTSPEPLAVGPEELAKPLPAEVVDAWKKAGARVGWMGRNAERPFFAEFGLDRLPTAFHEGGEAAKGEVPAFLFFTFHTGWKTGLVGKLPQPQQAFGLCICTKQMTDAGMKELVALKRLQALELSASITDTGLEELAGMKSLQSLDLMWSDTITDAGLKELPRLKSLQSLNLMSAKITDAGLKELAGMKLKMLNAPPSALNDLGLKHYLAAIEPPTTLSLGTQVTDAGLKELAALKDLQSLSLLDSKITDAGLKQLAGLRSLQTLVLCGTQVTDIGLKELAGLKSLQTLNLSGCQQVTDAGVAELQKALPMLKIQR